MVGYLAGYSVGSTGELLWDTQRDTRRDPLTAGRTRRDPLPSRSGGILGEIHWRAALAGYAAGCTGEPLWRDTGLDPLASGILGGIHWYSAGSTGGQLWRDTGRDPLASCSGGILGRLHWRAALAVLGGIHWRAALAGYWVGAWCRSIENVDYSPVGRGINISIEYKDLTN